MVGKYEAERAEQRESNGGVGGEGMKFIVECKPKEMADFITELSQPKAIENVDKIIGTIADKLEDTIALVSHTLQE